MFYYLQGKLAYTDLTTAVIDVGGVGYKLTVSGTTYSALPRTSAEPTVKLYTYMAVREDEVELFGFYTEEELSAFKLLITVSGVGPKAAMAILTLLTPEKFALAVCSEDTKTLAKANGIGAIIAGAGGAAHVAGVVAGMTTVPVIGIPIQTKALGGMDSLLSIVQMPPGVPVATMAINGAKNAALYAVQILALTDETLAAKLDAFRKEQTQKVLDATI